MQRIRAFTLIELLVVIAIIGILATIITASLSGAKAKGRDARRIADIKTIQAALALYYNDNDMYPKNIYAGSGTPPANGLAPTYIPVVPKDPSADNSTNCNTTSLNSLGGCYHYYALSDNGVCNATTHIPVLYHIGTYIEDTANTVLSQDSDGDVNLTAFGTFSACTTSAPSSFSGTADKCMQNGSTPATENCYDLTP